MVVRRATAERFVSDFSAGQASHHEKEQGISRNVQIEIDKAVNQKRSAGGESGEMQGGSEWLIGLQKLSQRYEKERAEEPGAQQTASETGFSERLDIIVVGMIDDLGVVQGFIRGINDLQRS